MSREREMSSVSEILGLGYGSNVCPLVSKRAFSYIIVTDGSDFSIIMRTNLYSFRCVCKSENQIGRLNLQRTPNAH